MCDVMLGALITFWKVENCMCGRPIPLQCKQVKSIDKLQCSETNGILILDRTETFLLIWI